MEMRAADEFADSPSRGIEWGKIWPIAVNMHCEARICFIVCSAEMSHTKKALIMSVGMLDTIGPVGMLDTIGQIGCFRHAKDRENSTSEMRRLKPR